jgi:hypothetical protein
MLLFDVAPSPQGAKDWVRWVAGSRLSRAHKHCCTPVSRSYTLRRPSLSFPWTCRARALAFEHKPARLHAWLHTEGSVVTPAWHLRLPTCLPAER